MKPALLRLALRHLPKRVFQSLLVLLGIALGVAVVVAVDIANASARRAFQLSTELVVGRATHQIVGGPSGVPAEVYRRLRTELGAYPVAPVVEGYVRAEALGGRALRLLGVDAFSEPPFRDYLGGQQALPIEVATALLVVPGSVLLAEAEAQRYSLEAGDVVSLEVGSNRVEVHVVGLLKPRDEVSRRALDGVLLADIATAQELFGMVGAVSRIDLLATQEGQVGNASLDAIEQILPAGTRLERSAVRGEAIEQMTRAFEINLTALSLLALTVGMFLIYNTVTFSVVQRRAVLGTLRALGVTRAEIFQLILVEALLLGVVGSLAGLFLGVLLSRETVRLVTRTISDLYYVVSVQSPAIPTAVLVRGAVLGTLAALFASLVPAFEATSIPPAGALLRSSIEDRMRRLLPRVTASAVLLLGLGIAVLLLPTLRVDVAFTGLFMVVIACALLAPAATGLLMRLVRPATSTSLGLLGRMAPTGIVRALSRTSVAIAALMVAVSVIVGVGIMVGSFRETVQLWLASTLQADIYISPPIATAGSIQGEIDPEVVEELQGAPGVVESATARTVTVMTSDKGSVSLVAVSSDAARDNRRYLWRVGDADAVWEAMGEDAVVVSEPFARRHALSPETNSITLQTDHGEQAFRVVGVFYDYASSEGTLMMRDVVYHRFWDDPAISSLALWLRPGEDADAVVERLQALAGDDQALVIRSTRGLRQSVFEVFDRAFAITGALRLLAMIVAFIGVLSALMALQLERAREIGTLRALGVTTTQLWGLTFIETGLMGATAGLLALPTGLLLAIVLVYVINVRSFGWTLQFAIDPVVFVQAFAVAVVAALLSGIYPAFRMGRLSPAEVLRGE